MGEHALKNIAEPVKACRIVMADAEPVEAAGTSLDADPNNLDALIMTAVANAARQHFEQARAAGSAIRRMKPDFSAAKYAAGQPYKDPRKPAQFISMLEKAGIQEKS